MRSIHNFFYFFFTFTWKNLVNRPLSLVLNLLLFTLGVGLISMLFLINTQVTEKMENNFAGIDLVIGAKGSPLQMVLCNMYHIDPPTGNISTENARPFLNPDNPLIGNAVPLSIGDNYKGFRIVGSEHNIVDLYKASLAEGRLWEKGTEVVIGQRVAEDTGLKLGDRFKSSHGLSVDINMVHDDAADFVVVGVLNKAQSVIDQLILCSTRAVWAVHDHEHGAEEDGHEGHNHDAHDHEGHQHEAEVPFWEEDGQELTAILVQFRNKKNFRALNLGRNINENTDLMAANPAYEVLKLQGNIGIGVDMMRIIAMIIVFVSALSVFFSLVNALKEKKYELALMRSMGASRGMIFSLIMLEGAFIAVIGYLLGLLLSHGGMMIFADMLEAEYRYGFEAWRFLAEEAWMLLVVLLIGLAAAIIPAIMASVSDISTTLSEE